MAVTPPLIDVVQESAPSRLSRQKKVALFIAVRGRPDVYPVRWESKTVGKSGYTPACANEWRAGVCENLESSADCHNRHLIPLSEHVIYDHLAGRHTVGNLPAPGDDSRHFLPSILMRRIGEMMPARLLAHVKNWGACCLEISRSGQGTWDFSPVGSLHVMLDAWFCHYQPYLCPHQAVEARLL